MELTWHQMNGAGMLAKSFDIVGYAYQTDTWCEFCTEDIAKTGAISAGVATMYGDCGNAEEILSDWARAIGIDRDGHPDTNEFPVPIVRDQSSDDDRCRGCGSRLEGDG